MPKAAKKVKKESLGKMVDKLYDMRAKRIAIQKQVDEAKSQERLLKVEIIERLEAEKLTGSRGELASASITEEDQPHVTDWNKVYKYIKKHELFNLLHQRIATTTWRDMLDGGVAIPGIEAVPVKDLSLTKANRG